MPSSISFHTALIAVTVAAAITTFFPLIGGFTDHMEDTVTRKSLLSHLFRESSYVIIGLAFTFIAMKTSAFVGDHLSAAYVYKTHAKFAEKMSIIVGQESVLFFAGTLVVPCIVFLPSTTPSLALIYVCASMAQLILYYGFILSLLYRFYGSHYFPRWAVLLSIGGLYSTSILWPWAENRAGSSAATEADFMITTFYQVQWASVGFFVLFVLRWLYCETFLKLLLPRIRRVLASIRERSRKGPDNAAAQAKKAEELAKAREAHDESREFFPVLYTLSCMVCLAAIATSSALFPATQYDLEANDLLNLNVPVIVFVAFKVCLWPA